MPQVQLDEKKKYAAALFFMLPQVKLDEGAIATGGSRGRHATFDEARGLALAPYQPRYPNPIT